MKTHWIALFGLVALMPAASTAQDMPNEGKFSITYTSVTPTPNKAIAGSGNRDVIMNAAIMTAVNDAGSGLLHNMAGRCFVLTTIDKTAKTFDAKGFCNYADRTGDQIFEEFSTQAPLALGTPVKYTGIWTGGSGRYSGLSGTFEITATGNLGPDGLFQVAGKKTGSYWIAR